MTLHTDTPKLSETEAFRKVLSRNVMLPLLLGLVSAGVFVALLMYLVSVMRLVDHSNQVISAAHESSKLIIDSETGLRGYMLTGRRGFLAPYNNAVGNVPAELDGLARLVNDNPQQVRRIDKAGTLFKEWLSYSEQAIWLKDNGGDVSSHVGSERGKNLMDAMRSELGALIAEEESLRNARNQSSSNTVTWLVFGIITLMLLVGAGIAYNGRRQLLGLSQIYSEVLGQAQQQASALAEQAWVKTGQNELAAKLLGEQSVQELARGALEQLVRYLGARVGALYVGRDDGRFLLEAGYALPAEHPAPRCALAKHWPDRRCARVGHNGWNCRKPATCR
ncbi:CHASE3 domain-containing protein [Chitinolyticbacter meiyuanensis]|uniref:CHASE3 domain-containing protein n=1 Tax=Chitinolyticbacter meiyuanensis TaxID=682798 RepID=UPI001C9E82E3|nr:CHASE3 domain-containing protein [Chitinolyticbacter meiyuanensis]